MTRASRQGAVAALVWTTASLTAMLIAAPSSAAITDFYETFASSAQNWRNSNGASVLNWSPSGGPGNAAYVTSVFNLSATTVGGFPPTVIRAQQSFGSSGGAYVGNWITAGVTGVTFSFRHNLAEAVSVTGRFATPVNTPGASTVSSILVNPNTWTTISFDLREGSSDIISLGGGTYATIFSNIGNMQFGFTVPAALAGQNVDGSFDMTNFAIVPAPGALALLALAGFTGMSRRRR
ncbi:MAG: PEP-CTERM sorting domain-containing protein [bacterium]